MPVDLDNLSSNQVLINLPEPYTKGRIYKLIGKASKIKDGDYYKHTVIIKPIGEVDVEDIITKYLNDAKEEVPEFITQTQGEEGDPILTREIVNPDATFVEVDSVTTMDLKEQGLECFKRQLKDFITEVENILKSDALNKAMDTVEDQIENQTEDVELSKGSVL